MKLVVPFLLIANAFLVGGQSQRVALEPPRFSAAGWSESRRAPQDEQMTVHLYLRHEEADVAALEEKLRAVSDPRSAEYGMYLSLADLETIAPIAPSKHAILDRFLRASPGTVTAIANTNGDIIELTASVVSIESLFETTVSEWKSIEGGQAVFRATNYTVPEAVAEAVAAVGDLVTLPRLRRVLRSTVTGSGTWDNDCKTLPTCKGLVTPAVLKKRYALPDGSVGVGVNNSFSVAEFQGQDYVTSDLEAFSSACGVNVSVDTVVGSHSESAGAEAELDIEYIRGLSDGQ